MLFLVVIGSLVLFVVRYVLWTGLAWGVGRGAWGVWLLLVLEQQGGHEVVVLWGIPLRCSRPHVATVRSALAQSHAHSLAHPLTHSPLTHSPSLQPKVVSAQ